jgi:Cd2+/Zn2+-exporting ATPase
VSNIDLELKEREVPTKVPLTVREQRPAGCCSGCGSAMPPPNGAQTNDDADADTERWQRVGALACGALALTAWATTLFKLPPWWPIALYALSVVAGAWPLLRGAWRALLARSLDMNVLMSIAVVGACILGDWGEAAALVFLYAVSEWLEEASVHRSRRAITGLMKLAPPRALVRRESFPASTQSGAAADENDLIEIDAAEVQVGQVFVVRSGERIALDGVVVAGHSDVDQAPVTGESLPVEKWRATKCSPARSTAPEYSMCARCVRRTRARPRALAAW